MCYTAVMIIFSFLVSRVYKVLVSLNEHESIHTHDGQCRLVSLVAKGDIEAIKNYKRSKIC